MLPVTLVKRVYERSDNPHGAGRCWHCGTVLVLTQRIPGLGGWHVDHWPVCRRDIVDQWLWGVRDIRDETNLVPACISCNTSHRHEHCPWYWGYRSQCPCTTHMLLGAASGTILALLYML
jgi:hypothetical protein